MIDIKDLQIGDLVNYRPGWIDDDTEEVVYESKTCFPIRLTCLYDGFSQYDDVLPDGSINTIEVADYEIFAIPLTPEILEKNGFGEQRFERMSVWSILGFSIELDFSTWKYYWANGDVEISSVHELQHALRLCRIGKTIEL